MSLASLPRLSSAPSTHRLRHQPSVCQPVHPVHPVVTVFSPSPPVCQLSITLACGSDVCLNRYLPLRSHPRTRTRTIHRSSSLTGRVSSSCCWRNRWPRHRSLNHPMLSDVCWLFSTKPVVGFRLRFGHAHYPAGSTPSGWTQLAADSITCCHSDAHIWPWKHTHTD